MNSLIISGVISICSLFKDKFLKSGTCSVLKKIYVFFSDSWKKSFVLGIVGNTEKREKVQESLFYRIVTFPFRLVELLERKISAFLNECIQKSIMCHLGRVYLHNFLALNTRFFGVMLIAATVIYIFIRFCVYATFAKIPLFFGVLGAFFVIFNFNFTSAFATSKFIHFCKAFLGFREISFDFYDKNYTKGSTRLVLSVVIGGLIGVLAVFNPLYAIVLPFAIFGMILVLYSPLTGIYAAVSLGAIVPTMILAMMCLWTTFAFVLKALEDKNFRWKIDSTGFGLIVLLAILFASSLFSFAPVKSIIVWIMYFIFITFFFVMTNAFETKEQIYALIKMFVVSGTLVALYGIMQYLFGWTTANAWIDETMFEDATIRVYSTLGNPNVLGEFLILVLPFAAVEFVKNKANTLAKYSYLAMMAVLTFCLVLTQSRGCWLGFLLCAAIFVTFYEGRLWGIIPIVLCILPFVLPQTVIDRLLSIGNMSDSSTSYRVFIWLGTLAMLKNYWLGGIGMGEAAFAKVYPMYSYNAIVAPHSHNTFLQLTVEAGIGALIVFCVTQFIFIKGMVKVYRKDEKKSKNSLIALATAGAIAGFLLQSMFDYTFYNYRVMALFFMVMAIGTSLKFFSQDTEKCEVDLDE